MGYEFEFQSPFSLPYAYNSQDFYGLLGNYYSGNGVIDIDSNGVDDAAYSGLNFTDNYPLAADPGTGVYDVSVYTLSEDHLREGNFGEQGYTRELPSGYSWNFRCETEPDGDRMFAGGSKADKTTWHGWITFTSALADGYEVFLDFGTTDLDGNNFDACGPRAVLTGDGSSHRLEFVAERKDFTVPDGLYLAMRMSNPGEDNLHFCEGGVSALIVPPQRRQAMLPIGAIMELLD